MINASQFLILNGVIVTLLLIFFFFAKGKTKPSRLNFKKGNFPLENAQKPLEKTRGSESTLNVIFNYNGHSFDAYEVLGVPAGSTMEEIQQVYQHNRQISDPASQEFFRVAFESIKQHLNNTRR